MKNINKLALLLSLGALLPVAASAKTLEQSYIDSCRKGPGIPVPIAVVAPEVEGFDVGQAVQVEFVVETTGRTSDVTIKSASDRDLAAAVVDAVKQWQFTPAQRNGAPVATKVILPVRVVAAGKSGSILALN
jgi:protein TonB